MVLFDNYEVRSLANIELLARQVVEGFIIGLHKSPFHGFSVEFAEHRLYNPGENTKNIDWKVYGRTDKMFTKRFEEETNLRCQILLDVSSSMYFPDAQKPEKNKLGFSALAAAALMNLLMKQRDAFGLSIFDEEVRVHTKSKSGTTHYRLMLSYLEQFLTRDKPKSEEKEQSYKVNVNTDISFFGRFIQYLCSIFKRKNGNSFFGRFIRYLYSIGLNIEDIPPPQEYLNHGSKVTDALHEIAENTHRRSLVCIFSDMFEHRENTDELFNALQHLKYNKHEVILFHVVDHEKELLFEYENRPTIFVDMETGEKIRLQPAQVKEFYRAQVGKFAEQLRARCLQYRIDLVEADISKGFGDILQAYLVKRTRMKI